MTGDPRPREEKDDGDADTRRIRDGEMEGLEITKGVGLRDV